MSDLGQPAQPNPAQLLNQHLHYQVVHTLCRLLPAPLDDTPEALHTRNQAAIAKVAALLPVNADEADLAAHTIAARAQAEDVLRDIRANAGDIRLVMRLNAQFALMERTALANRAMLLRVQTARYRREANTGAANADEWAAHIATQQMQAALEQTAPPGQAPSTLPPPAPVVHAPVPPQRVLRRAAVETDEPVRDLAAEADHYAKIYPYRARPIRQHGGLPPDCHFGPPDDDLLQAIVAGTSPVLRALDAPAAVAA